MTFNREPPLRRRMAKILDEGFTAMDIAEPLASLDGNQPADIAREFMEENHLKIIGIRKNARIIGYATIDDLNCGNNCGECVQDFGDKIITDSTSIAETILKLKNDDFIFVSILGTVSAIVTRADIDKPPVRMWLFGIVTILDMFISRKIEEVFPDNSWQDKLSAGRLEKAIALQQERLRRKQRARLIDCLQLTDKAYILIKDPESKKDLGFNSKRDAERHIKNFESLRNNLAHSQTLTSYDWDTILVLASRQEKILTRV